VAPATSEPTRARSAGRTATRREKKARRRLQADLYAIIKATEVLERAYARAAVSASDYEKECAQLIAQFKASERALTGDGTVASAAAFFERWRVDCPRARDRLLRSGAPATLQHGAARTSGRDADAALRVAECVQCFITAMDALKLDQRAVDEVQPLIADLAAALDRAMPNRCPDGRAALLKWLERLHGMRAAEELDEPAARQLSFDLDSAYSEFHRALSASAAAAGS